MVGLSAGPLSAGPTPGPASAWRRHTGRKSDVSVVPPTPDGFDFLDEEPDPLAACGLVPGSAIRGTPVAPLLRTPSDELEDVLRGAGEKTAHSRRRSDPLAAVLGRSSPAAKRESDDGLWEVDSPDPLAELGRKDAAASRSPVARRAAADELLEPDARAEADPLDALQRSHHAARTRSALRRQRLDPLAGVLEAASADDAEDMPAHRAQHASPGRQLSGRSRRDGGSLIPVLDGGDEDLDAALLSFSGKRAAAALDTSTTSDYAEPLGGGSLPASPRQRRVKARPAGATKSIASLRSFACGSAKTAAAQ